MSDNHGNTPAAWTAVTVAMLGFVVGAVGLMLAADQLGDLLDRHRARRRCVRALPGDGQARLPRVQALTHRTSLVTATAPPPVAEEASTTRWQRVRGPALVIGGLAVATLALRLRDPHEHGAWGSARARPWASTARAAAVCGRSTTSPTATWSAPPRATCVPGRCCPSWSSCLGRWVVDRWTGAEREPTSVRIVLGVAICSGSRWPCSRCCATSRSGPGSRPERQPARRSVGSAVGAVLEVGVDRAGGCEHEDRRR